MPAGASCRRRASPGSRRLTSPRPTSVRRRLTDTASRSTSSTDIAACGIRAGWCRSCRPCTSTSTRDSAPSPRSMRSSAIGRIRWSSWRCGCCGRHRTRVPRRRCRLSMNRPRFVMRRAIAGSYVSADGRHLEVVAAGGRLVLERAQERIPLQHAEDDNFIADHADFDLYPLVFERDSAGQSNGGTSRPVIALAHGADWYARPEGQARVIEPSAGAGPLRGGVLLRRSVGGLGASGAASRTPVDRRYGSFEPHRRSLVSRRSSRPVPRWRNSWISWTEARAACDSARENSSASRRLERRRPGDSGPVELELARIADHALEVQSERIQHGLRDRLHLLLDIVLAVERMAQIVERLRARPWSRRSGWICRAPGGTCAPRRRAAVSSRCTRPCSLRRFL